MRSNPSQYFVKSVNGYDISEAGENWLWQRRGSHLRKISPSSVEEPTRCNSLSSPCITDNGEFAVTTWNWVTDRNGYDILGLADKLDLKSKLTFRMQHNSVSAHNSISEFNLNFNFFGELMALEGKGGAI